MKRGGRKDPEADGVDLEDVIDDKVSACAPQHTTHKAKQRENNKDNTKATKQTTKGRAATQAGILATLASATKRGAATRRTKRARS